MTLLGSDVIQAAAAAASDGGVYTGRPSVDMTPTGVKCSGCWDAGCSKCDVSSSGYSSSMDTPTCTLCNDAGCQFCGPGSSAFAPVAFIGFSTAPRNSDDEATLRMPVVPDDAAA